MYNMDYIIHSPLVPEQDLSCSTAHSYPCQALSQVLHVPIVGRLLGSRSLPTLTVHGIITDHIRLVGGSLLAVVSFVSVFVLLFLISVRVV